MPKAQLSWSLNIKCPACGANNDLAACSHDSESDIARHLFNNDWDALKEREVTCELCGHEFKIDEVEY